LGALVDECDIVLVEAGASAASRAAGLAKGVRPLVLDLVDSMPPGMLKLAREADVVLCATEEGRAAWEAATERAVNVVPDTDPNDPLRPLRLLVEEPKRFGFKPATREDLQ